MLTLDTLKSQQWVRKKSKRVWRWNSSWKWTFSWRGCKGQNSRSWWGVPDWFEGGQTPLFRRTPKMKGFSNAVFKKRFNIINIEDIERLIKLNILKIDTQALLDAKIIRRKKLPVKLLWWWILSSAVEISVDAASQSAISSVNKAWWTLNIIQSS